MTKSLVALCLFYTSLKEELYICIMATLVIDIRSFLKNRIISPEIAHEFAVRLDLQYIPENEAGGRVCFAAHSDVRPEFRDTFTTSHLQDYIYAVLHSDKQNIKENSIAVPYPTDVSEFWKLVQEGNELR
jgi:hypothetical protein